MTFEELLDQVLTMLQRRGRVSYRALTRQFALDEAYLEDLKDAILFAHPQVIDEAGRGLVWSGDAGAIPLPAPDAPQPVEQPVTPTPRAGQTASPSSEPHTPDAERRQLTVLFCDLVDSTWLACQLDPEELREVVRAYQDTCAKVIARFEGHIAQYLGDGLLVYFGYPLAHEDDAQRAVRAGLGMIEAVGQRNTHLGEERGVQLAVRLGIHTGLVVVGEVGGGTRQEQLALGETPNLAARLQGIAAPNTVVISAATLQLLGGFFACQSLGTSLLKGFAQPLEVYQVLSESTARSRLDAAGSTGLTPLVGREQEVGLLLERWAQAKDGLGQVVLLSGKAGIGKSRLVQVLKEHVATEPQAWLIPCQCVPYYQNTALGNVLLVPYFSASLAAACDHLGHTEDGLQALAEAQTLIDQHEELWWEAEVCRLRGVLLLRQPGTPQAEAETWLQQALDVARRQQAKSLELRAAVSLGRLWQRQGKRAAALELLAPIYGWFTEGFDTADLQEAKALLVELQR